MDISVFPKEVQLQMMTAFGQYLTAQIVKEKEISPSSDPPPSAVIVDSTAPVVAVTPTKENTNSTIFDQETAGGFETSFEDSNDSQSADVSAILLSQKEMSKLENQLFVYNRMVVDNKRLNNFFCKVELPHVVGRLEDIIRTKSKVDANAPFLNTNIR
jgi:hypothetical protein